MKGVRELLLVRLDGVLEFIRRGSAVLLDGSSILQEAILLPIIYEESFRQSRFRFPIGLFVLCHQLFVLLAQSLPPHRELGQSLQWCGLAMQVGNQPVTWPSLLIPVGLDKGS